MNYFIYARKSTDVEDKQIRSIEDQLSVLHTLAKEKGLTTVREFVERQSAKKPGRTIFNEMISRIEKGEAEGIISWKLDRLARNPVDSGKICWLLQQGIIQHIQTHDRNFYPTDNVLMTSVEFGMANQYILDLRANVKRGLLQKAKRGEYPAGLAPIGYLNDTRTKLVVVDKKKSKIIRRAFELYAQGDKCLEDISKFLHENRIKTHATNRWQSQGGKPLKRDQISYILANPFYVGLFRYAGELYEGKHQPIISKHLFDKVQEVLKERSRPPKNPHNNPQALCGLLRCGTCKMMITAEHKFKYQKNGNIHEYVYYRCTRKNKTIKCAEPSIREEVLNQQITKLLQNYVMPNNWAAELLKMADKDKKESAQSTAVVVRETQQEIQTISQKLQRLLDAYLDQDIEREIYKSEKSNLLSRKKSLEEKITNSEQEATNWVEPLRKWVKDAQTLNDFDETTPLHLKKSLAQKIFGLNLVLSGREAAGLPQNQWAAVSAAHQEVGKIPLCSILMGGEGFEPP